MATNTAPRAALYLRISKDKAGGGLGVDRQRADCRKLADRLGFRVVATFTDNDVSATRSRVRPEYQRLLTAVRNGEVDAVLCWHTDRLHRSPVELEAYISACEPRTVTTHTVAAGPLDLTTAQGLLMARISGAVARHETDHQSERIRAQKERAAANGEWIGGARAFGFEKDGVTVRESEAELIREGVHRVLAGESLRSLARDWSGRVPLVRGGTKWAQTSVRRILTRPRNAALLEHRGVVVGPANWQAIIGRDEYDAVRALLLDPARSTHNHARTLTHLGAGLYRCSECDLPLRSATEGTNGHKHTVYRCRSGKHVNINGAKIDEFVETTTVRVLEKHGAGLLPGTGAEQGNTSLHEQGNALRAKLDELADMLGEGELDRRQYTRQKEKIETRLGEVNEQLAARAGGSVLAGVADAPDPAARFKTASVDRRRAIIDTLMTVTVHPGKKGRPVVTHGFDYSRIVIEPRDDAWTA